MSVGGGDDDVSDVEEEEEGEAGEEWFRSRSWDRFACRRGSVFGRKMKGVW